MDDGKEGVGVLLKQYFHPGSAVHGKGGGNEEIKYKERCEIDTARRNVFRYV